MSGASTPAGFVIAVDGPGGVGKTTVSRAVAEALGCAHLDTGAFYRATTVVAMLHHLDLSNDAAVMRVIAGTRFDYEDGRMLVEGIDMSEAIRTRAVTARVSRLSTLPGVRLLLARRQREWLASRGHRAVVEGRDIGTVVFPQAPLKVFLMARPEVRASRRAGQQAVPVSTVQEHLARRDHLDSTRQASPLVAADDAVVIDTSDIDFRSVVEAVLQLAAERGIRRSRQSVVRSR